MKAVTLAFLVSLSLGLSAAEVRRGDSFSAVKAVMGEPRGQARAGVRQLLFFDRGVVELQYGAVSRVALLSVDEYAVREAKQAAISGRIREEQEVRLVQLRAEGQRIMARRLADPVLQAAAAADQVAFWEDFSRRYPDVDSSAPLAIARQHRIAQIEANLAREAEAQHLADLEARMQEAETARVVYVQARRYRHSYNNHFDDCGSRAVTTWPVVEYHFNDPIYSALSAPISGNVQTSHRNEPRNPSAFHSRAQPDRSAGFDCPRGRTDETANHTSSSSPRGFRL